MAASASSLPDITASWTSSDGMPTSSDLGGFGVDDAVSASIFGWPTPGWALYGAVLVVVVVVLVVVEPSTLACASWGSSTPPWSGMDGPLCVRDASWWPLATTGLLLSPPSPPSPPPLCVLPMAMPANMLANTSTAAPARTNLYLHTTVLHTLALDLTGPMPSTSESQPSSSPSPSPLTSSSSSSSLPPRMAARSSSTSTCSGEERMSAFSGSMPSISPPTDR
mmetsp:Transcript_53647/g.160618  ORF Transcript_53647/g.160618 Transcript_53647/m.160618 type:complete len:223 (+) Transcript_53647:573-1241(+)